MAEETFLGLFMVLFICQMSPTRGSYPQLMVLLKTISSVLRGGLEQGGLTCQRWRDVAQRRINVVPTPAALEQHWSGAGVSAIFVWLLWSLRWLFWCCLAGHYWRIVGWAVIYTLFTQRLSGKRASALSLTYPPDTTQTMILNCGPGAGSLWYPGTGGAS